MQRVFLKPTTNEIVIKGNSKEGHTDVFAYDYYADDNKRKLGGLYIVGNVKQDDATTDSENTPDIAYVINLVASLAKREYYSKPDIPPREAFSATLKKINDVVEEFFKNKSLKVNIGIFAVAGEQILISKLGKFKIILGRDSRTIDILNNVDLFNKEQIEEKAFSNIVSGKIMAGDKLFAFYPNRMVIAREKTFKADLLKFEGEQFLEKINSVKETKPDFDCRALYLYLDRHKEPSRPAADVASALSRRDRPQESKEELRLNGEQLRDPEPSLSASYGAGGDAEVPRIISSEFSLGRKNNPLLSSLTTSISMVRELYNKNINLKRKFVILSLVAGILIIGVVLVKTFVVIDPEQRQLNVVIDQTQNNLKLVRTKISQNDLIGARRLLNESLSNIYAVGITNDRTQKTTEEVYEVLDDIDKAVDVSPSLLEAMPEELNQTITVLNAHKDLGIAFDIYENNLYILTSDNILKLSDVDNAGSMETRPRTGPSPGKEPSPWLKSNTLPPQPLTIAVDGSIYVMNGSGTLATYYKGEKVSETNTFIVSGPGDVLLTSKDSDKLYLINKTLVRIYELDKKTGSLVKTIKVGSSKPFVDAYLVGDSTIIVTTPDGRIWEIK